jgi:hypothetical protein
MGVAAMNPGDTDDTLNLEAIDSVGTVLATATCPLSARSRLAGYIADLFPGTDYHQVARVIGSRDLLGPRAGRP